MHSYAVIFALSLVLPSFSLPTGAVEPRHVPALFNKDPLSIHKRSTIPESVQIINSVPPTISAAVDEYHAWIEQDYEWMEKMKAELDRLLPEEEQDVPEVQEEEIPQDIADEVEELCGHVCGLSEVQSMSLDPRAQLCSVQGLSATLECAQCIDINFPDTTWEHSAMAEYERLVRECENDSVSKTVHDERIDLS